MVDEEARNLIELRNVSPCIQDPYYRSRDGALEIWTQGRIVRTVNGNVDSEQFKQILQHHSLPSSIFNYLHLVSTKSLLVAGEILEILKPNDSLHVNRTFSTDQILIRNPSGLFFGKMWTVLFLFFVFVFLIVM